jgi:hypothetical protein
MMSKYLYLQLRHNSYHMEKYFKSFSDFLCLSKFFLSKPALLLCFVDPSLNYGNRVKAVHRSLSRCTDARSSG